MAVLLLIMTFVPAMSVTVSAELRNDFKEKERFIFSMKLDHISIKKSLKAYFDKYYK